MRDRSLRTPPIRFFPFPKELATMFQAKSTVDRENVLRLVVSFFENSCDFFVDRRLQHVAMPLNVPVVATYEDSSCSAVTRLPRRLLIPYFVTMLRAIWLTCLRSELAPVLVSPKTISSAHDRPSAIMISPNN